MDDMKIEVLVVPSRAHESATVEDTRTALDDIGLGSVDFTVVDVDSQQAADSHRFVGSPSIYVDGADIFREPDRPASVACRIYPGGGGVPDLRDLRQALKRAAAVSASR